MRKPRVKIWRGNDEKLASLPAEIKKALQFGAVCVLKDLCPRHFVDLMTRSSFEIGRIFKRGLRDVLYERRKQKRKKA